jgi:hypothetical protein
VASPDAASARNLLSSSGFHRLALEWGALMNLLRFKGYPELMDSILDCHFPSPSAPLRAPAGQAWRIGLLQILFKRRSIWGNARPINPNRTRQAPTTINQCGKRKNTALWLIFAISWDLPEAALSQSNSAESALRIALPRPPCSGDRSQSPIAVSRKRE